MRSRRPTGTINGKWMTQRLLLVLMLAVVLAIVAGASAAVAAPARDAHDRAALLDDAASTGQLSTTDEPASGHGGSSPVVPLVFAGIVILAATGPWVPPGSRYVSYRVERRW